MLTQTRLEEILDDVKNEPQWREEASKCAAYYDGLQLTSEQIEKMTRRGLAPLTRNIIQPTIDLIIGMEAKNRRDFLLLPETREQEEIALAMQAKLHEAERTSRADEACSLAYEDQVKAGLGWVEVGWEKNPFRGVYRTRFVHRREIWWDWRAREWDLSDARYLVRRRWLDLDVAQKYFKRHAKLIEQAGKDWPIWDRGSADEIDQSLLSGYEVQQSTRIDAEEWRDYMRQRVLLYEVWYRDWKEGVILRLPNDSVLEYDPNNEFHNRLVVMGLVEPEKSVFPEMRLAWAVGPHKLEDNPTHMPHNEFVYTPFWGYREDMNGMPYGLIRRMMSPQDEVNSRLSRMHWLLAAKRVMGDSDAFDMSWADVAEEAARPDAMIRLNPRRRNKDQMPDIATDFQLSDQQFKVLQDAMRTIQDPAYTAMLGQGTSVESGSGLDSLVEQGATTLGKINLNYKNARLRVGEQLLYLVQHHIGNAETQVDIRHQGRKKTVLLNHPVAVDGEATLLTNTPAKLRAQLAIADVSESPTYKQQIFKDLVELTKSLDPDLQRAVMHIVIRASDLPNKDEVADEIARVTGATPEDLTPEEQAEIQQQKELEAMAMQLELAEKQAGVAEKQAKVYKLEADREHTKVRTAQVQHDMIIDEQELDLKQTESSVNTADRLLVKPQLEALKAKEKAKAKPPAKAKVK